MSNILESDGFTALILAAGMGTRFGIGTSKQFLPLHKGQSAVEICLNLFRPFVKQTILVVSSDRVAACSSLDTTVCIGGATRQLSVHAGLTMVQTSHVIVHDAARPAVNVDDVTSVMKQALEFDAAILAHSVVDTIKRAHANSDSIEATVDRTDLWIATTPQVFRTDLLKKALSATLQSGITLTDDSAHLERIGLPVQLVQAKHPNPKLTYEQDIAYVRWLLDCRAKRLK